MSKVGLALWRALDKPENWEFDEHTFNHIPTKSHWWIANGGFFFELYEVRGERIRVRVLGYIERHFLYAKYVRIRNRARRSKLIALKRRITTELEAGLLAPYIHEAKDK